MTTLKEIRKDYKEQKEEWNNMLKKETKAKHEKCTKVDKNGKKGFDYLKMSEMYHKGEW